MDISNDIICDFCGEMKDNHKDTLSLKKAVGYDMTYMFAYRMIEKNMPTKNMLTMFLKMSSRVGS